MDPDKAQIFDPETHTIKIVDKNQINSTHILVNMEGIKEPVWVEQSKIKPSQIKNPALNGQQTEKIMSIKKMIDEAFPLSFKEWEEGFRRDSDPDTEISLWLKIASTYALITKKQYFKLKEKKEILSILINCSNNGKADALTNIKLRKLSQKKAEEIVDCYFSTSI